MTNTAPNPFTQQGEVVARNTDPLTSHESAAALNPTPIEISILLCILNLGGATTNEITDATGIPLVTVSPRLRPMKRKKLVEDSGEKRRGNSGRRSIVWAITSHGLNVAKGLRDKQGAAA